MRTQFSLPTFKFGYVKTPLHGKVFVALHGENLSQAHILKNEKDHFCMKNIRFNGHEDLVLKVNSNFSRSYRNEIPVPDENSPFIFTPIKGPVKKSKLESDPNRVDVDLTLEESGFNAMYDVEQRGIPKDFLTEKGLLAILETNYPLYNAMRKHLLENYQFSYGRSEIIGEDTARPYISLCGSGDSDCFIYLDEIKHIFIGSVPKGEILWGTTRPSYGSIPEERKRYLKTAVEGLVHTVIDHCYNVTSVELSPHILGYVIMTGMLGRFHGNNIIKLIINMQHSIEHEVDMVGIKVPEVYIQNHDHDIYLGGNRHIRKLVLADCRRVDLNQLSDTAITHLDVSGLQEESMIQGHIQLPSYSTPKGIQTLIVEGSYFLGHDKLPSTLETLKLYSQVLTRSRVKVNPGLRELMIFDRENTEHMDFSSAKGLQRLMLSDYANGKGFTENEFQQYGLKLVQVWEIANRKFYLYERMF